MVNELDIDNDAVANLFDGNDLYILKQGRGSAQFSIDGSNSNGVAIVYNSLTSLGAEDRDQLNKILSALKLDPNGVGMVNLNNVPAPAFTNLAKQLNCKYMLVFGATPADMGMLVAAKRYIELPMQNVRILFSDSLETLRADSKRKRYLWDCLQLMFAIK
jgi:DNA polymerase III psi subunit